MQGLQHGLLGVRRGLLVQILEALPGSQSFLSALLGNIKFSPESQSPFSSIEDKQHRVTVVALKPISQLNQALRVKALL